MNKTKIILVDDHSTFRKGLKMIIQEIPDVEVVAEASTGLQFLDILKTQVPDLAFIDIRMQGMSGLEAARQALELFPDMKIIMLSMFGEVKYYEDAFSSGASGFLLKPPTLFQIQTAYNAVMKGETYFPSMGEVEKKSINS